MHLLTSHPLLCIGAIASLTLIGVPTALSTPQSPVIVWNGLFTRGMAVMPKVAITTALCYLYAAYKVRGGGERTTKTHLAAAGLVISIIPFTLIFMRNTNEMLLNGASAMTSTASSQLISKWGNLNMVRSLLPLAAGVLGLYGLCESHK
ncbi:hypothetical protein ISF_00197 [Cordyceps fumosorosea ARSEF 2679]|uniref:DUF1772-domain-containing protein n=1 Tax=Cordyceps fumosorosea (strain ARSEF 2679) TaxID=1081104 RepID=A0A168E2E4_CORFA|nr:hypothetical protein ISF_00197 [Cordyceps fumosorosea ARSEF 2679]OAA73296.1 hypothetical protein ISF_00197 [Cordyceps fumosorosea ARSEF 2679]